MNFGFLARCDEQGVAFHQVGEATSAAAELLDFAADDACRAVVLGRLYYRDDLRRRLAAEHRPDPSAGPAAYVLAAYRQAGREGLTWLEGDYALALWDGRRRLLLASRDPFGGFPLYWVRAGDAVVLATAMRPLLDLLLRRAVDRDYLAEFLTQPTCGVQELNDKRCAYEGVHRILPGTCWEASPGQAPRASRWWDWLARVEEPASLEPEDLARQYGALLREAVRQRRVGRTAAHLSGGMDSTAIALLAARDADAAGDEPVHGLSLVYERLNLLSRERPYLDSVGETPGLRKHRVPADDLLEFDAYRLDPRPDEPVLNLYQSMSNHVLMRRAVDLGVRTVMTGFGADELVEMPPYHLHDLLRRGRWLAAWRESARWATAYSCSRWGFLGPCGLKHFLPAALRGGLGCWLRGGRVDWKQQQAHTIAPWVRPEFARRYGMWPRAVARLRGASGRCRPLGLSVALEFLERTVGDATRWELGAPHGLLTVHPFRDCRLVRFCLGFQGRLQIDPRRQKPILADALRDMLPAKIRERSGKGHFDEVFFSGLARNRARLEALVRRAPVDELGLLDRGELLRCLQQAALGVGSGAPGVDRLSLTLALLKWLTQQEDRTPGPRLRRLEATARPAVAAR